MAGKFPKIKDDAEVIVPDRARPAELARRRERGVLDVVKVPPAQQL